MKIVFFEIHNWERDILKKVFAEHDLKFYESPLTKDNISEVRDAEIVSIFIYSKINKEVLKNLKNVKLISTRSMGFDHIDLKECKKRKIKVSNTPHYGDNSVAEHAFALILSISRNVHKSYIRTTNNNFSIEGLKGFDLKGKILGVIGTGRIGSNVVRIANGFGMKVIAFDEYKNNKLSKELHFPYLSLNEVLAKSDIITLHVPYMKSTHHLINSNTIKKMKPGVIIINTSRGPVIETKALLKYLDSGKIQGIGLDVLEGEELIKEEKQLIHNNSLNLQKLKQLVLDHKILKNEKVVFTPHIAFYTDEAIHRILETEIFNLNSFMKGKPVNLI